MPEVRSIFSKLGRPEDGTDPKIASQIEVLVDLFPEEEWKRKITKAEVLRELDLALQAIPGIQVTFSQPIRDNVLESISQVDGQIVIKVFGDDLDTLRTLGGTVLGAIGDLPGVAQAMIDRQGELPQTLIEISDALDIAREDESIGVIILTGAGDAAVAGFVLGLDAGHSLARAARLGQAAAAIKLRSNLSVAAGMSRASLMALAGPMESR